MKHNLENIPEVSIDKVDAFYVTGTQHRDAAGKTNNLKLNLKTLGGGIDLTDKEALRTLWNALQDAITIVITEADVEEYVSEGYILYRVINTEGFPDDTWALEKVMAFTLNVVGVFHDIRSGNVEYQVSSKLSVHSGEGSPYWEGGTSDCAITLIPEVSGNIMTWSLRFDGREVG